MNTLPHQLYDVGTLGTIVRDAQARDGSVRVMVQGFGARAAQGHRAGREVADGGTRAAGRRTCSRTRVRKR